MAAVRCEAATDSIDPTPVDCRSWRRFRYDGEVGDLAGRMFLLMEEDGYVETENIDDSNGFASVIADMLFDPDYDHLWEELFELRRQVLEEQMSIDEFRAWLGRVAAHETERLGVTVTAGDFYQWFHDGDDGDGVYQRLRRKGSVDTTEDVDA